MNLKLSVLPMLMCACMATTGCDDREPGGPPTITLGESMCAECGMILSDERFATVTIFDGPRGADPYIFDDFNCQAIYESEHEDETIIARWSHDYTTIEWIPTEQATFVKSPEFHTPMGSQIAAFASKNAASNLDDEQPLVTMSHAEMVQSVLTK